MNFIKLFTDHVSRLLSPLFNLHVDSCKVSHKFKDAKVTPIFKKGFQTDCKNIDLYLFFATLAKDLKPFYIRDFEFFSKVQIMYFVNILVLDWKMYGAFLTQII